VVVEKGKYSYDVETLINKPSRLTPLKAFFKRLRFSVQGIRPTR
jgi:hypothetical protein